jgi:hypothetical protein
VLDLEFVDSFSSISSQIDIDVGRAVCSPVEQAAWKQPSRTLLDRKLAEYGCSLGAQDYRRFATEEAGKSKG